MSFLSPGFLASMAVLILPILLHFWSIKKAKKQFFSNTALLKKVNIITNKASKLKHLLLLASRLLFLFFLTIAFGKLYKANILNSGLNTDRSHYKIDASCSVMSSPENKTRLNAFLKNTNNENETISQDCQKGITYLSDLLQEASNDLLVISDFQKGFVNLNEIEENAKMTLVLLDNNLKRPNVFIDSMWLEERYFKSSEKNIVWIKLENSGNLEAKDILIELKVDGKTIASQIASIPKRSEQRLSFQIFEQYSKPLLCSILVNDGSWDFDNVFSFVLTPAQNLQIMLIADQQQISPIKIAYDQEALFQCKIVNQIFNSSEIEKSDLLILSKNMDPSKAELLQVLSEARKGKTLVILPSPNWSKATFEYLNSELGPTVFSKSVTVKDSIQDLEKLDINNPFLSKIFSQVPNMAQTPSVKPICVLKGADEVILRTKDGNTSLGLFEIGKGKIYAFAFGLYGEETFSRDAIFLPIFYRIAESSIVNSLPHYLRKGEKQLVLRFPEGEVDNVYSLRNAETKIVTEQKVMGNKTILNLPDNMSLGFWHVIDKQNNQLTSFGYNLEKAESNMQFYTDEDLSNKFKKNKKIQVIKFGELDKLLSNKEKGNESIIWRYVVGISFLFLLFEILVARFYNRNFAAVV